ALAIRGAEECAELAIEVFRVNAKPWLAVEKELAAVPFHRWNRRNLGHGKRKRARSARGRRKHAQGVAALCGFAQGYAHRFGTAVAPHGELRGAAGRNLPYHAAKLCRAFDALAVDFRNDVVFLEAGFRGRTVRNDGTDNHAALGGKFQLLRGVAVDLAKFYAKPAGAFVIQENLEAVVIASQGRKGFQLLDGLGVLGKSHLRGEIRPQLRGLGGP